MARVSKILKTEILKTDSNKTCSDSKSLISSESLVFGYTVYAFAACTSAAQLFGAMTISIALLYLFGGILLLWCASRLILQPALLLVALAFPVFALISAAWSTDPSLTLKHASQLIVTTLIGASIGCSLREDRLLAAMCIAYVGLILASVANFWLQIVPPFQQKSYLSGSEYFTGIYVHKNILGVVLCMGALTLMYFSISARRGWIFLLAAVALLPVFLFARSTTSTLLYLCILCMPAAYLLLKLRIPKALVISSALCTLFAALLILELLQFSAIDFVLAIAGKGRDLSGRTGLWDVALEQIATAPWTGIGYQTYWTSTQFMSEINLIRGILEQSIGSFHNVWLETLVGTGILGTLAFAALPVVLLCRFTRRFLQGNWNAVDLAGCFLIGLLLARGNVEASLYRQHQSENLALIALLFATSRKRIAHHKTEDSQPDSAIKHTSVLNWEPKGLSRSL